MTEAEKERAAVVRFMRTEPASGKATLILRLQLAWLFFWHPHRMVERSSKLIADRIEQREHLKEQADGQS